MDYRYIENHSYDDVIDYLHSVKIDYNIKLDDIVMDDDHVLSKIKIQIHPDNDNYIGLRYHINSVYLIEYINSKIGFNRYLLFHSTSGEPLQFNISKDITYIGNGTIVPGIVKKPSYTTFYKLEEVPELFKANKTYLTIEERQQNKQDIINRCNYLMEK